MTLADDVAPTAAQAVSVAETPEDLALFRERGCAAAIWYRTPLSRFQTWIDSVPPERLPRLRTILRPEHVRKAAHEICDLCKTPDCAERALLIDDTAALADLFAGLMKVSYLRMRWDVIATNQCRKFHTDAVAARLICTYRGSGTQYGISADGEDPRRIFTVPTGAPILLRGTKWPEAPRSGLLHRSPPIEGTGETRLVLVLDPVADLEQVPGDQLMH